MVEQRIRRRFRGRTRSVQTLEESSEKPHSLPEPTPPIITRDMGVDPRVEPVVDGSKEEV